MTGSDRKSALSTHAPGWQQRSLISVAVLVLAVIMALLPATPASAAPAGNIYNNSDHGMWFATSSNQSLNNNGGPLKWVPAKTWSSAVGVVATGVYIGKGYCAKFYQSDRRGGWAYSQQVRGLSRSWLKPDREWLVYEWQC